MKRRNFLRLTVTTAMAMAIAPSLITQKLYAEDGSVFRTFEKVQLKDADVLKSTKFHLVPFSYIFKINYKLVQKDCQVRKYMP